MDTLTYAGWDGQRTERAQGLVADFAEWVEAHRDSITALQIFYGEPWRRRDLTYAMIKQLYDQLRTERPALSSAAAWHAYEALEGAAGTPLSELTAIVALVRRVCGIDEKLTTYDRTVDRNFKEWTFRRQAGAVKYSEEQMQWLRMIKDCIAASFHVDRNSFELDPFNKYGGLGRFYQLFGEQYETILIELNEALAA